MMLILGMLYAFQFVISAGFAAFAMLSRVRFAASRVCSSRASSLSRRRASMPLAGSPLAASLPRAY